MNLPNATTDFDSAARELAGALVEHHKYVSLRGHEEIVGGAGESAHTRIIALVGAGASARQFYRSPELLADLMGQVDRDAHTEAVARLQFESLVPIAEFEQQMLAMTGTPEDESRVRQRAARIYGKRHPTLLCYELLAHLLKHRFIDGIISFNWDELLDQSLDDELGRGEYLPIVSERDCHNVEFDPSAPDYKPVYIKLHGTAGDPETLRFTRTAYYFTPRRLLNACKTLVGTQRCVLISLGWGFGGSRIGDALKEPAELTTYNLAASSLLQGPCDEMRRLRGTNQKQTSFKDLVPEGDFDRRESCDRAMDSLMKVLEAESSAGLRLRKVSRHRLVSALMAWEGVLEGPAYLNYLLDRTVLELALSITKSNGLASTAALVEDRGGRYYDQYVAECRKQNEGAKTWHEVCALAGLEPLQGNTTCVLCAELSAEPERAGVVDHALDGVFHEDLIKVDVDRMAGRIGEKLTPQTRNRLSQATQIETRGLLLSTLRAAQDQSETEVLARNDLVCAKIFKAPIRLVTQTAMDLVTRKLLDRAREFPNGCRLAIVAETGQWLIDREADFAPLKFEHIDLIVAFPTKRSELEQLRTYKGKISIMELPWFRHNRHMMIICDGYGPRDGIYFVRRLRAATINPVRVTGGDAVTLMDSFIQLSVEAGVRAQHHRFWKEEFKRLEGEYPRFFKRLPSSYRELAEYHDLLRGPRNSAIRPQADAG